MTVTNLLKRLIISDLNSRGHLAWNNNTLGVYDPTKKCFRRNADRSAIGTADVICCLKGGYYLEIEAKTGDDKQSPDQQKHEAKVKQSGGKYFIVKDFNDYRALRQSKGW
jgi:hypothetical protein